MSNYDADPTFYVPAAVLEALADDVKLEPWRARAACAGPHTRLDWFFAESSSPKVLGTRRARIICGSCPVRVPCLDFALRRHASGVWAGTTLAQRRAVRKLGHEQAMEVLLGQAKEASTTGAWRSRQPEEWEGEQVATVV